MDFLRRLFHHLVPTRLAGDARRSYRLPTEGSIFVAVTMLIGLAAINTSTQLLFLVFAMMCAFYFLSATLAGVSLWGVEVERRAPKLASANRPTRVALRVANTKRRFASMSLRLEDSLEGGGERIGAAYAARVPPGSVAEFEYECVFPRRGLHRFESITLATLFPFGLIERKTRLARPGEVLVLPPSFAMERPPAAILGELGDAPSARKGIGVSLHGLREYASGDSARDIHWRSSARRGSLVVREFESEEHRRVAVLLDNRMAGGGTGAEREAFERGIVLAGSFAAWAAEAGHEVQLLAASGRVGFGVGPAHAVRIRRALAEIQPAEPHRRGPDQHLEDADCLVVRIDWRGGAPAAAPGEARLAVADFRAAIDSALAPPPEESAAAPAASLEEAVAAP